MSRSLSFVYEAYPQNWFLKTIVLCRNDTEEHTGACLVSITKGIRCGRHVGRRCLVSACGKRMNMRVQRGQYKNGEKKEVINGKQRHKGSTRILATNDVLYKYVYTCQLLVMVAFLLRKPSKYHHVVYV